MLHGRSGCGSRPQGPGAPRRAAALRERRAARGRISGHRPARPPAALSTRGSRAAWQTAVATDAGDGAPGGGAPLADALESGCGLSRATAERIAAAAARYSGVSGDADALRPKVAELQRVLGRGAADRALHRFPQLLACRVGKLEGRLQLWQDAFPDAPPGQLRRRLLARPQLLAVAAESAVPGLFEMAVIAGVQRPAWAGWAYRALPLALMRPAAFEARLRRALVLINDGPAAARAAAAAAAAAGGSDEDAAEGEGDEGAAAAGEVDEVGGARLPPGALGTALLQQHSPPAPPASGGASSDAVSGGGSAGGSALPPPPFTLVDVQKAAERDFRWLTMREALVAERLEALQAALGVPWHAAARAFLRQPSLLHRRPELLSARAASLAGLDGLGAARATRALLSMPALLNLGEAVVAGRWRALQQAADSHPPWRAQLDAAAPATAASMLVRSEARMARLVYLVESNQQGGAGSLKGVLDKGEAAFEGKFGGYAAWAAARGGGAAAGGGAGAAAAAGAGDAAEGDAAD